MPQCRVRTHHRRLERCTGRGLDHGTGQRCRREPIDLRHVRRLEQPAMVPDSSERTAAAGCPRQLNLGEISSPHRYAVHDESGVVTDHGGASSHRVHRCVDKLPVTHNLSVPRRQTSQVEALGVLPVPHPLPAAVGKPFANLLAGIPSVGCLLAADNAALPGRDLLQLRVHPTSMSPISPPPLRTSQPLWTTPQGSAHASAGSAHATVGWPTGIRWADPPSGGLTHQTGNEGGRSLVGLPMPGVGVPGLGRRGLGCQRSGDAGGWGVGG